MGNCVSEDPHGVGCAAQTRQNWDEALRQMGVRTGEAEGYAPSKQPTALSLTPGSPGQRLLMA